MAFARWSARRSFEGNWMGVNTGFVVADHADAQRVCNSRSPKDDFPGFDAKGIDTVKLGRLQALLSGREFKPSFMADTCCSGGEDGPWVHEVPTDLVQRLGGLSPEGLQQLAEQLAATEEFSVKYVTWSSEAVLWVLQRLTALCKRADDEGKAVFMWRCL